MLVAFQPGTTPGFFRMEDLRAELSVLAGGRKVDLDSDGMLRGAVVRRLEVLGEAAPHVSEATRYGSGEVPWRGVVGMRNVLIHV